jgi:hypothetical protein
VFLQKKLKFKSPSRISSGSRQAAEAAYRNAVAEANVASETFQRFGFD